MNEQYVCTRCGFNIIGHFPANCPLCGAPQSEFITSEECSRSYSVEGEKVASGITQLLSVPRLGFEHAAYQIEAEDKTIWIDCPSCFDQSLAPADTICFTHHHFLGASNLYRDHFKANVQINKADTGNNIASRFTFDRTFTGDFSVSGLEAYHVDGHTRGFTCYVFGSVLFICDYVFVKTNSMKFNPYGPQFKTRKNAMKIAEIAEKKEITLVCGYNYVEEYSAWQRKLKLLISELPNA